MKTRIFTFLALAALLLTQCKKQDISAHKAQKQQSLIEQAAAFVKTRVSPEAFNRLNWAQAHLFNKEGQAAYLRIPVSNPQAAAGEAIYLTYSSGTFKGNYFSINNGPGGNWAITTQSLDGKRTCSAVVTAEGRLQHCRVYVEGSLLYEQHSTHSARNAAIGRVKPVLVNNAMQAFIWASMLGMGQEGWTDPSMSNWTNLEYLSTDPSNSNTPGGSTIPYIVVDYDYLDTALNLSTAAFDWLWDNTFEAAQLYAYLKTSTRPEKKTIAQEHIDRIMADAGYANFVKGHTATGNELIVWWEDDAWLDNPNNFNLDIDPPVQDYDKLTGQEKALIANFPVQAYTIKQNVQPAFSMSLARMGAGTNNGVNDKKDAFRHAFFNAINTRDVLPRLFPVPITASAIVKLFADAHESEVPAILQLEKQMDLFNNQVGIDYCWNCYTISNDAIADAIMAKLLAGELRYLSPLDPNNYTAYNPNTPNCTTCTNAIVPGLTALTATNL